MKKSIYFRDYLSLRHAKKMPPDWVALRGKGYG